MNSRLGGVILLKDMLSAYVDEVVVFKLVVVNILILSIQYKLPLLYQSVNNTILEYLHANSI